VLLVEPWMAHRRLRQAARDVASSSDQE
jgi:hypothetical protein